MSLARLARRVAFAVLVLALILAGAVGVIAYREITRTLPTLDAVVEYHPPVVSQVFSDDGTLIGEFYAEKRYLVPIDHIPMMVRQAFIAAEDEEFYQHQGIDVVSMMRAFLNNVVVGTKAQGASTITQQVVRALLLTRTKSYERKIKEIILALRLERELSKDEILGLYLNHIYLGSGAHGVAAAAREYFGKELPELTLAEAALLAGLPQAPSNYSPFQHWPRAKARQRYVLTRMYDANFISRAERDAALMQPIELASRKGGNFRAAAYFVEQVRRDLEGRLGYNGLYELGLRVYTTVNLDMQRAAEAALRAGLDDLAERHAAYRDAFRTLEPEQREQFLRQQHLQVHDGTLDPSRSYDALVTSLRGATARVQVGPIAGELIPDADGEKLPDLQLNDLVHVRVAEGDGNGQKFLLDPAPPIEGALVAIEPRTGFIRAMVGGYDFDRSRFNRVTQARRQPGSAFKPLVYAAALDRNFTMGSVVIDEPIFFQTAGKVWSPQNFEKKYFGPTTLHTALVQSRNVVTVKVANAIGVRYVVKYLKRFGFTGTFEPNLSIALGSAELTPMELALAFTTFANGGMRPTPISVREITDTSGRVLERNDPAVTEGIPAPTAFLITNVLQDAVKHGTGKRADGLGRPVAGKTGTTNDQTDVWFVGYTPQLLAAVWVGFDAKRSIGKRETGGKVAAPIWKSFMDVATKGMPIEDFAMPDGISCFSPGEGSRECYKRGSYPGNEPYESVPTDDGVRIVRGEHPEGEAPPPDDQEQPQSPRSALEFLRQDF
jgi:penicillin-binding protein 1A